MHSRILLVLAALSVPAAFAQSDTAVLRGRITDSSGLGAPGAQLTLTAESTGVSRYFNTAAFVQPVYSFGDVGRNSMTGASLVNLDAKLARNFRIRERANLQIRAEFFNLANHPNYGVIGRVINDPTFGIVQNQLPPRQIQVAAKLSF